MVYLWAQDPSIWDESMSLETLEIYNTGLTIKLTPNHLGSSPPKKVGYVRTHGGDG